MKEYSEIEIIRPTINLESILSLSGFLPFKFSDFELGRIGGGVPKELIKPSIIKFETQGYYEGIPISKTKENPPLEIFKSFKREFKIADGIIKYRYFEKAMKSNFNIKEPLEPSNSKEIKLDEFNFSNKEKLALELGITPLSMNDKWFSFYENDTLHYYRSWTGIEIFKGKIIKIEDDKWIFKEIKISKENSLGLPNEKLFYHDFIKRNIQRTLSLMK